MQVNICLKMNAQNNAGYYGHYLMRCASWTLNVDQVFHHLNFFLLKTSENTIYDFTLIESYLSVLKVV